MDIPNKQELLDESEALLSFEKQNIIRNFNDFNRNPDDMLKHRVRVGRQIEKLNGILKKCQKHIQ
jgi:hypothetical protein